MSAHTLIIADVHLQPQAHHPINHAFLHFLNTAAPKADALYILGDLFEIWLGDDIGLTLYQPIIDKLKQLSDQGLKIYLLYGNRDFLMDKAFWHATGIIHIEDPYLATLYNTQYLLMHGDSLCTDDKAYQRMRKILRHRWFKQVIVRLSKAKRESIGLKMRQSSKQHSQRKSLALMDVTQQAVCDAFKVFPTTLHLIHGHTHRPQHHIIEAPHATLHRWVLGDWRATDNIPTKLSANIIMIDSAGPQLIEFKTP